MNSASLRTPKSKVVRKAESLAERRIAVEASVHVRDVAKANSAQLDVPEDRGGLQRRLDDQKY